MNRRAYTLSLVALALLVASCGGVRRSAGAPAPQAEPGLSASEMRDLEVGLLGVYANKDFPLTLVVDGVPKLDHVDVSIDFLDFVDRSLSPDASPAGTEGGLWRRGGWSLTDRDESGIVRRPGQDFPGGGVHVPLASYSFPWRVDARGRIQIDEHSEGRRVLLTQPGLPEHFRAFALLVLDHGSALTVERVDGQVVALHLGEHRFEVRRRYAPEAFAPDEVR